MEPQEAYEKIRSGILEQGALGQNRSGQCVYLYEAPNGSVRKCAAGQLLPVYSYRFENQVFSGLLQEAWQVADGDEHLIELQPEDRKAFVELHKWAYKLSLATKEFIYAAQNEHDSSHEVDEFIEKLDRLAARDGLKVVS
jgi:hypothetical protein